MLQEKLFSLEFWIMARADGEAWKNSKERPRRILALERFGYRQRYMYVWKGVPYSILRFIYKGKII